MQEKNPATMNLQLPKPNYMGVFATCFAFFTCIYMTSIRETIATPLVADQYGIADDKAVFSVSIALSLAGFISVFLFVGTARVSKMIDERKLLIFCGMLPIVVGVFLHYPMGNKPIVTCDDTITTAEPEFYGHSLQVFHLGDNGTLDHDKYAYNVMMLSENMSTATPEVECYGCPISSQPWCNDVPQIQSPQLIVSFLITIIGYPIAMSLCQTVFSKILGPTPQGLWMGVLTGSGSLARVTGPFWIAFVYEKLGTIYTYMILGLIQTTSTVILLFSYKKLVPMKFEQPLEMKEIKDGSRAV